MSAPTDAMINITAASEATTPERVPEKKRK